MAQRIIPGNFWTVLALTATTYLLSVTEVAAGLPGHLFDQTGCCQRCPACDHVCKLETKMVDEEKTCFDVESKIICIPRVVFPWQNHQRSSLCDSCDSQGCTQCTHNGARTRKICVLKTVSHQCPRCKYSWSAEKKGCTRCGSRQCTAQCEGCDSAWSVTGDSPMPMIYPEPVTSAAVTSAPIVRAPVVRAQRRPILSRPALKSAEVTSAASRSHGVPLRLGN